MIAQEDHGGWNDLMAEVQAFSKGPGVVSLCNRKKLGRPGNEASVIL